MKKLIATLLVPALALGLASCNRSEEDRNRITLALSTQTNPFFVELRHGAQDKAKELGVPLDIQDAAEAIGEKGDILILQGTAGTSASRERGKGFEEQIAKYGDVRVVGKQSANFDRTEGLNVATNLLQANPSIKAIFAENDEMALGAVEALGSRAGTEVKVVAFDGTFDGLKAVKDGKLEATIAQQPAELGARAIEQAAALLHGGAAEKNVPVEVITVTRDNVEDFQ